MSDENSTKNEIYCFYTFEAVKIRDKTYGDSIEFNNQKHHIKFTSKFHGPEYLSYDQVSQITVKWDPKNWLYLVGLLTIFVFVGFIIILARTHLPPWEIKISLKNTKPLSIRARLDEFQAFGLVDYCKGLVDVQVIEKSEKIKNKLEAKSQSYP